MIINTFKKINIKDKRGITLIELLITMTIFLIIMIAVGSFVKDIFSYNKIFNNSLTAYDDIRKILQPISSEVRSMSSSSIGSYPIELAQSNSLVFFADINNDGLKERIRYYLSGNILMKGIIVPSGNPLQYLSSSEISSAIIPNVNNGLVPIFNYYDNSYTGGSLPLAQPVNISKIRLIGINLIVDADLNNPPKPVSISTEVSLRNLKDNL